MHLNFHDNKSEIENIAKKDRKILRSRKTQKVHKLKSNHEIYRTIDICLVMRKRRLTFIDI